MARCLISFGANLGIPAVTIAQAADQIRQLLGPRLVSLDLSRLVRTPAVGGPTGQPPFVNAVAALEVSACSAWDIWHIVRQVEHTLGRVRQERWEARRIDLDVLLFDDQRIWTAQFKLPHPRMVMRRFILQPALDVAADWLEPVSGWSIARLASSLAEAPASIVLVSHNVHRDQRLVDEAARIARCELQTVHMVHVETNLPQRAIPVGDKSLPATRWLGMISVEHIESNRILELKPRPNMVFVLAPTSHVTDAAWEDVHRPSARWMGLCPSPLPAPTGAHAQSWPLKGPRYLLSTDDLAWAQHEIIAAVDALDCPVEPIKS